MRNVTCFSTLFFIASIFLRYNCAQAEDRPAVNAPPQPKVNLQAFNAALQQRNQAVEGGQLFEDFAEWNKENIILIGLQKQMQTLQKRRNTLLRKVQPAQAMAPRNPVPLQQLRNEIENTEQAIRNLAGHPKLGKGLNVQAAHVAKLWGQTLPRLQQWLNSYYTLRSLLPMDPTSADFAPIKTLLGAEAGRPGALEMKVWLALMNSLGGDRNPAVVAIDLQQAIRDYTKFYLLRRDANVAHWDIVGGDLFLACLYAGMHNDVKAYANDLEELPAKLKTPYRKMLICLSCAFEQRDNDTRTALKRAAADWGLLNGKVKNANDNFESETLQMVAGQFAFFHFTCRTAKLRDPVLAAQVLNLAPPAGGQWVHFLAKSADAAQAGNWGLALTFAKDCEARCPAPVLPTLQGMRAAYQKQQLFVQELPQVN